MDSRLQSAGMTNARGILKDSATWPSASLSWAWSPI